MPMVELFDKTKNKVGQIELSDRVFGVTADAKKEQLVSEVVKMQAAAVRQGTHSTKTYATISGGNSKPWKQKGTGRARRGTMRASTLRGGAPAFGPQPRSYAYTLPLRKRAVALTAVLSERLQSGNLFVIKDFNFDRIKTKDAVAVLKKTWELPEAIIVANSESEGNFLFSMSNLQEFAFLDQSLINVYDIVAYKNILFTEEAAKYVDDVIQERLMSKKKRRILEKKDGE